MTNDEVSAGLFREARDRLRHARLANTDGSFAFAFRLCQESVELALKAVLLMAGVDPPKWHDVGEVLVTNVRKFRGLEESTARELARISSELRQGRERAMYGDDVQKLPPQRLFDAADAAQALKGAEQVMAACERLLKAG